MKKQLRVLEEELAELEKKYLKDLNERKIDPLCYHPDHKFYTSYYTPPNERPEKKLNSYKKIISDAEKMMAYVAPQMQFFLCQIQIS